MPFEERSWVTVYTDGACNPNLGHGGWGAVLLYDDRAPQELVGWKSGITTNNRMELRAALEALRAVAEPYYVKLLPTPHIYVMVSRTGFQLGRNATDKPKTTPM